MKSSFSKNNIFNMLLYIAVIIISFLFVLNIITMIGYSLKIGITPFHFPISFIVNAIFDYYLLKKMKSFNKRDYLVSIFIVILTICFTILIAQHFMDISYDGGWYHLTSIIGLSDGWNPVYDQLNIGNYDTFYSNYYASKAIWNFSATVLSLTNNINAVKILSMLMALAVFCLSTYVFDKKIFGGKRKYGLLISAIISILISLNPVFLSQMYTNYIDSTLGLVLIFYILLFLGIDLELFNYEEKLTKYLLVICIVLLINMKFTGLFFAGIFYILFSIRRIIKIFRSKDWSLFKNVFFTGFIGLVLSLIVGFNPYITNVLSGHHIFHPLFGPEKVDVMGNNVPESLRGNKNNIEKLFVANFSNTYAGWDKNEYALKNPLTVTKEETYNIIQDTRIGGFGPLFPLSLCIMLLCIIILPFCIIRQKEISSNNKMLLLAIAYIAFVALIFSESWWARYYVPLWLVPILIGVLCYKNKEVILKALSILLISCMFANILIVNVSIIKYNDSYSLPLKRYISGLRGKEIIYNSEVHHSFYLQKYFKQNNIKAQFVDNQEYEWDFEGALTKIKVINGEKEMELN